MKLAIVDKCPNYVKYSKYIPFLRDYEVDILHLCSVQQKKVLKKDVDLDNDLSEYDFVLLIGSEAAKHFAKITSVSSHAGTLVEDKFIPMINPSMLAFKPEAAKPFEDSVAKAKGFIEGTIKPPSEGDYKGIESEAEAIQYFKRVLKDTSVQTVAVDTETSALYPREGYILGLSMSHREEQGVYISSEVITENVLYLLQEILDSKSNIVMQNCKFDIKWMEYHFGLSFPEVVHDTMILHYMLDETPGSHGLKQLALKYTNLGDYEKDLDNFKKEYCKIHGLKQADFSYEYIPFNVMYPYACKDTAATIELFNKFKPLVDGSPNLSKVYRNIMLPGIRFLNNIENNGVPFSPERITVAKTLMEEELEKLKEELYSFSEVVEFEKIQGSIFNPNSTVQLRKLLFDFLNLTKTGKKTDKGADSTDAEVLTELSKQHPIPKLILDIRQNSKIKNTYLDKIHISLDRDNRLRTGFNLTSTTSGRLSSSGKLNMQQLPRDNKIVKACIKARPGYKIVSQDLGTAEMYYAAVLSKDEKLMSVFKSGEDFHSTVARMVFNLPCEISEVKELYGGYRQAAKAISFGILYGSGASKVASTVSEYNKSLSEKTGEPYVPFTEEDAREAIDTYFSTYRGLKRWLESVKKEIRQNGYIYSALGRKRRLANVFSSSKGIAAGEVRSGVNFLIQSVASDINLLSAIDLHNYINDNELDVKIFALVHDSILCEVREDLVDQFQSIISSITQKDRGLSIEGTPISVDFEVGDDYSFLSKEDLEERYPKFKDVV